MKNELTKKLNKAAKPLFGESTDALIIVHDNGQCGVALHGDAENIAQSLFTCMHDKESDSAESLYRIFKLNLMNILNNPSKYKLDIMNLIANFIQREDNE